MIELSVSNLEKEFEVGQKLLHGLTFQVDTGERVGLLGVNGSGKTTLLHILTGQMDYDGGEVFLAPGRRVGLMSQIPKYPQESRVLDVLQTAFAPLHALEEELADLSQRLEHKPDPKLLETYDRLLADFERKGGYETQTKLKKVCQGLNISGSMEEQPFAQLSGGEKTRVNLARLILEDTDILLLDEPTNHLDLSSTQWLEEYLDHFPGTVLTVSHDRYFLDRVVDRIIELQNGQGVFYHGNYTFYVMEREQREKSQQKQYEREQAKIAQLEETARVMHQRGTARLHRQAFGMERRIQRMGQIQRPVHRPAPPKAQFAQREFRGDEVFTLSHVTKSFGTRTLFSRLNVEVKGGERIALLGDNGSGKTTLLNMMLGEEEATQGRIRRGPGVRIGYLPQQIHFDHPEYNLVDTLIHQQHSTVQSARNRLGAFQFSGEDVLKPVSALSGGEQSRLKLCMLMDEQINLLVLDEPTNHLDLQSREWIEEAVQQFEGNLLFVSHDRYFIQRFATRIWWFHQGQLFDFHGTYEELLAAQERGVAFQALSDPQEAAPPPQEKPVDRPPRRTGGSKQLEKEVAAIERNIAKWEEELKALSQEMEVFGSDYVKLQNLCQQAEEWEDKLSQAYDQWEQLSAQLEEVKGGSGGGKGTKE